MKIEVRHIYCLYKAIDNKEGSMDNEWSLRRYILKSEVCIKKGKFYVYVTCVIALHNSLYTFILHGVGSSILA